MGTINPPDWSGVTGSKFQAVRGAVLDAIETGAVMAGDKLPPVRELAWEFGVTPGTVARAYSMLIDERVLVAGVGRGTYVAETAQPQTAEANAWPDMVSMYSPRLPDVGQSALLRQVFHQTVDGLTDLQWMNYPTYGEKIDIRRSMVRWLADVPLGRFTAEEVIPTLGGQNGISTILQAVLKGPTPVIAGDELGYAGYRRAAEALRAEIVPVPWDDEGPRPDALEKIVHKNKVQIYCTSAEVNNPTSRTVSLRRRREIAELALRLGLPLLDDDCYKVGGAHGDSYRALAPELAWYVTSVSKSLTPALRVGCVVPPRGQATRFRRLAHGSNLGMPMPLFDAAARFLDHPDIPGMVTRIRQEINARVQLAVNHLGRHDVTWRANVPLLWITLPPGWRGSTFARAVEEQGVRIKPGDEFTLRDAVSTPAVRLAINGQVARDCFEDAIVRIRDLLDYPPGEIGV